MLLNPFPVPQPPAAATAGRRQERQRRAGVRHREDQAAGAQALCHADRRGRRSRSAPRSTRAAAGSRSPPPSPRARRRRWTSTTGSSSSARPSAPSLHDADADREAQLPEGGQGFDAAAKKKKKRRLWGDGKGRFRTKGKHSAATVVGTKYLVEDRCGSTLTRVKRGRVQRARLRQAQDRDRAHRQALHRPREAQVAARRRGRAPDYDARRLGGGWMKSSLEIAQDAVLRPIEEIADALGLEPDEFEPYGRYKAKIDLSVTDRLADRPDGKLICVTGMTPTKAGEGKTTTLVGLTQGLGAIGKRPVACLREPSLGPVFGIKGGAAGGGDDAGGADGGPQPPLHRRHPRDRRREQPAGRDARRLDPARQPAQDRPAADRVAPRRRHERPGAALDHGGARRTGERLPARERVRHHGRERGDGDHGRRARPAGSASAARAHHGRVFVRRREAGDGRGPRCSRCHGGAPQGRAQAEPHPDAGRASRASCTAARSRTSRTATTRWWRI